MVERQEVGKGRGEEGKMKDEGFTSSSEQNMHLERLGFDDRRARAGSTGGQSSRDGMDTMQRSSQDEIFVRRQLRETLCATIQSMSI